MRKSFLLILFLFVLQLGYSQSYKPYPMYFFAFTRYVIWPDEYNKGDFEILVLGDTPLIEELKGLSAAKKVGDRPIKVTKINSISEIRKSNMIFVPIGRSAELADVISKVNGQPTLIITEEQGLGAKGSHIKFIQKEGKLAFELNQASTTKNNLKVSSMLTSMAILI
jgi:hypothetical protein